MLVFEGAFDQVRPGGCIDHSFRKEVGAGFNRGHHFSKMRWGWFYF
jgi:hypothetical protein